MDPRTQIEHLLSAGVGNLYTAAVLKVALGDTPIVDRAFGLMEPGDHSTTTTLDSIFDIASLTKIFTAIAFMRLVDRGETALDTRVSDVFDEFNDPAKSKIQFVHLLSHTSGMAASVWTAVAGHESSTPEQLQELVLQSRPLQPPGTGIIYSDINYVIIGLALERLSGKSLDLLIHDEIVRPLGLKSTWYNPKPALRPQIVATGFSRYAPSTLLRGVVHDPFARLLGGISGHAGLFSCVHDLALLNSTFNPTDPHRDLLSLDAIRRMTSERADNTQIRRGLGWALQSGGIVPGPSFSRESFGHNGFTGCSIWIDPADRVSVTLLANRVYFNQDRIWPSFQALRHEIHSLSKQLVNSEARSDGT